MRIDKYQAGEIYRSFAEKTAQSQPAGARATKTAGGAAQSDRVEISREASDMQQAKELASHISASETPEDRQARIADIKNRIESGQYTVASSDVARSILLGGNLDQRA